ncbi:MAG: AAA family ATPase [Desulfuromonadales bacterium]|nr:AAA family ATPase [Desulfuromonadales bacterium]
MAVTEPHERLPVVPVAQLDRQEPHQRWLITDLWGRGAVGIIGGAPKCCKSWLGLDMATSVASATPCLGRFSVEDPGTSLIYLAEDALPMVRARVAALCEHRGLDIAHLDVKVIATPTLRLDRASDQQRLAATLEHIRPRLLLLDPLVRLHRLDENSAADISGLLGYLRELQRCFATAVVLVHHASKKHRAQPGQALRGSGDLHAFGDDNAYLARHGENLVLTLEHRQAKAPEPLALRLASRPDGSATHLEPLLPLPVAQGKTLALADAVVQLLAATNRPLGRTTLRAQLKVNNQRLGDALTQLQQQNRLVRTGDGWQLATATAPSGPGATTEQLPLHLA